MGTNYYVAENKCECCNRYDEKYHIGKQSYGWAFTFRGYKYDGLVSWQDWKEFLRDQIIMNEYGDQVPYKDFVEMVETWGSPTYVRENDGVRRQNRTHNDEGRKSGWFRPEHDWDDQDGYSFGDTYFS